MLPSKKRLSRPSFSSFLGSRDLKNTFNQLGTLKYKKSPENQVSIVISSKVEKRAVYRNRLKRRIYNIFNDYFRSTQDSNQFVLYVSKQASLLDYENIKTSLNELFKKITK